MPDSESHFIRKYRTLSEILLDHKMAALGDAYVNFVYSLALSEKSGEPTGEKVRSQTLSRALKNSSLRSLLPSRTDRHTQANAAEALIVYAWLRKLISIDECTSILKRGEPPDEAFSLLLRIIRDRIRL